MRERFLSCSLQNVDGAVPSSWWTFIRMFFAERKGGCPPLLALRQMGCLLSADVDESAAPGRGDERPALKRRSLPCLAFLFFSRADERWLALHKSEWCDVSPSG